MSFNRKTDTTTGKQSKSKSRLPMKAPQDASRTQKQSAPADDRVSHDGTQAPGRVAKHTPRS